MAYQYNTIEQAIEDLRAGKIILVTDDPNRENEGGFPGAVAVPPFRAGFVRTRLRGFGLGRRTRPKI